MTNVRLQRRSFLFLTTIVILSASLGLTAVARAQTARTKVSIRLDWLPGAQHAPFYMAKARGYYEAEGLDLTIIAGSGSSDAVKQVGSAAVQFGLVDALVLVQAAEQRVPLKAVAAYYQRTPIALISPQAKPITTPQQMLRGPKIGSKKGSATFQGLTALLAANNIQPEQVSLVDIGFGVQPLLVHQVDALMGFVMNEAIEAQANGMAVATMPIADQGVHVYGLTIVVNDGFAAKQPDAVKGFLRATFKGMKDAVADRPGAIAALAASVDELKKDREAKVLDATVPFWTMKAADTASYGMQDRSQWQQTVDTAKKLGLVETAPALDAVFTAAYAPK